MTKKTLDKLPDAVLRHIEKLRQDYKDPRLDKTICRRASVEYMHGLRDAGLIDDRERQALFIYTTI